MKKKKKERKKSCVQKLELIFVKKRKKTRDEKNTFDEVEVVKLLLQTTYIMMSSPKQSQWIVNKL